MNDSKIINNSDTIRLHTPEVLNRKMDEKTEQTILSVEANGLRAVRDRLKKLDREWDIDKATNAGLAAIMLMELLAARKKKKWLMAQLIGLPMFVLKNRLGKYSPSILLRFLGFRTRAEIEKERNELLRFLDRSFPYDGNQSNPKQLM